MCSSSSSSSSHNGSEDAPPDIKISRDTNTRFLVPTRSPHIERHLDWFSQLSPAHGCDQHTDHGISATIRCILMIISNQTLRI